MRAKHRNGRYQQTFNDKRVWLALVGAAVTVAACGKVGDVSSHSPTDKEVKAAALDPRIPCLQWFSMATQNNVALLQTEIDKPETTEGARSAMKKTIEHKKKLALSIDNAWCNSQRRDWEKLDIKE
jgi:apolipoprotein N-acyltransferase